MSHIKDGVYNKWVKQSHIQLRELFPSRYKRTAPSSGLSPLEQSDSERNQYKKAIKLLIADKLDAAKEIFLKFKTDRPELAGPYANLAVIALKNNEDYAIAHYNIALLYDIYLQDVGSAIPHYERYLKLINNEDKNTSDWLEQLKRTRGNS